LIREDAQGNLRGAAPLPVFYRHFAQFHFLLHALGKEVRLQFKMRRIKLHPLVCFLPECPQPGAQVRYLTSVEQVPHESKAPVPETVYPSHCAFLDRPCKARPHHHIAFPQLRKQLGDFRRRVAHIGVQQHKLLGIRPLECVCNRLPLSPLREDVRFGPLLPCNFNGAVGAPPVHNKHLPLRRNPLHSINHFRYVLLFVVGRKENEHRHGRV